MKISITKYRAAIALLDCMVYIGVFSVILSLSYVAFGRFSLQSKRLRQSAADISQSVQAGEMWREDVRAATGDIKIERREKGTALRIPQRDRDVLYIFEEQTVSRQRGEGAAVPLLVNVKTSAMRQEPRQHVTTWEWEIELNGRDQRARVRPLFSFQAVTTVRRS
jgi:hypothetical protein